MLLTSVNAFTAGSTGEVGKALTHELARSPQLTKVTLLTRPIELPPNDSDKHYSKFDQKIVDFDRLTTNHAADFTGYGIWFMFHGNVQSQIRSRRLFHGGPRLYRGRGTTGEMRTLQAFQFSFILRLE